MNSEFNKNNNISTTIDGAETAKKNGRGTEIRLVLGDITKVDDVDAIVNAASETLLGGGGVDGAIHAAAGPELLMECRKLGGCEVGEAKITGAYDLPCEYVIHTVGPVWDKANEQKEALLSAAYTSSLEIAMYHGIRKIAFPSISTGAFGCPVYEGARIAMTAVRDFISKHPDAFDLVEWVLFDDETYDAYDRILSEDGFT